jgi:hypothetical protein
MRIVIGNFDLFIQEMKKVELDVALQSEEEPAMLLIVCSLTVAYRIS